MKEHYQDSPLRKSSLAQIDKANTIVSEFAGKGFKLTIRQLYYQMVARGFIPNSSSSYDNLVNLMTKARLAGLVDWDAIVDRTRDVIRRNAWDSPQQILNIVAKQYHERMWDEQEMFVMAIIEKEALAEVFEKLLEPWDVPLLPARGYASATVLREIGKYEFMNAGRPVVVLHFGDHDPSGFDMSRDLEKRLRLFSRNSVDIDFRRLALNMDQIEEQQPPPFPAKITDSRYESYVSEFGTDCWELDALSPEFLRDLIDAEVDALVDHTVWDATEQRIQRRRERLAKLAENWKDDE